MRPSLPALLSTLALAGCVEMPFLGKHSCSDFEGGTFESDGSYGVSEAELQEALDADGELSEAACHDLCRANHWMEELVVKVNSCSVELGEPTLDTALATGDTGGMPHAVACSWTEEAVCEGRAHAALSTHAEGSGPSHFAAWLARAAHAEAASVKAFVALGRELDAHGAPTRLVAACQRAATDEVDHARRMGALAAAHGGRPTKPRMGPTPVRSLRALAVENAVEGCVRETWSAMVAYWQAQHATDPTLRRTMARIAVDEARHGELAHDIHRWAMEQLDDEGRAAVRAARHQAVRSLVAGLVKPVEPELVEHAGLPSSGQAIYLARQLAEQLWQDD